MHDRLFAHLGEQAVLRNSEDCRVNIERGVAVNFEIGDDKFVQSEYAAVVDVANIRATYDPTPGDSITLVGTGETFVIDAIAANNGFMVRCILRSG